MRVNLNGTPTELPDALTVSALLAHLGLSGPVAVERNREVVPRALHGETTLEDGDEVEVVHFVGGG